MAGESPVLAFTQKFCVKHICFPMRSGKGRVDSQAFSHMESGWGWEVHPDMGTQKYMWLLQFKCRPKYCPQIASPDTGADHLKKVWSPTADSHFIWWTSSEEKKCIHEMERKSILINSIIRAKTITLHVSQPPPEKWKTVWWKKAAVLISVILKTSEHWEMHQ